MDGKVFKYPGDRAYAFGLGLKMVAHYTSQYPNDLNKAISNIANKNPRNPYAIIAERLEYERAMEMTPEEFAKNYIRVKPKK